MPEPTKRIIVDGVEFGRLFLFPRIFSAVTASLQPGRWVIGLLMLVALITFGRAWDGVTSPSVNPGGLTTGRWSPNSVAADTYQTVLRDALREFPPVDGRAIAASEDLRAKDVVAIVTASYRNLRSEAKASGEVATLDRQYVSAIERINGNRPRGTFEATMDHVCRSMHEVIVGFLAMSVPAMIVGAGDLLITTPLTLWDDHKWFTVVFGLFFVVVYAAGGGAISRMAACHAAGQERLTVRQATDFAISNWVRLVSAVVLPIVIALGIALCIVVIGVLMGAPVLDVIGGLIYGLALVLGCLIAFLLLGYIVGFPMLVPAVAVERCDGADAMQRAYAYAATRPLHLLVYWALSLVGLALGFILVGLFAWLALNATASLFGALTDNPALTAAGGFELFDLWKRPVGPIIGSWHSRWAGTLIQFWQGVVVALVGAYVLAYHFSASTLVYLLMRRVCDGQDIEEIWRPGLIPGTLAPEPRVTAPPLAERSTEPG